MKNILLGKRGEEIAADYLKNKGYQILETNWRYRRAELDLIAMQGAILVFVEVKTRSSDRFGTPESFISRQKENFMAEAANVYMEQIGHEWEIRFDFIAILFTGGRYTIEHFEDAFFPTWDE